MTGVDVKSCRRCSDSKNEKKWDKQWWENAKNVQGKLQW